jgi:hypothetical protein
MFDLKRQINDLFLFNETRNFFNYLRDYDNGKLKLYNFFNDYKPVWYQNKKRPHLNLIKILLFVFSLSLVINILYIISNK